MAILAAVEGGLLPPGIGRAHQGFPLEKNMVFTPLVATVAKVTISAGGKLPARKKVGEEGEMKSMGKSGECGVSTGGPSMPANHFALCARTNCAQPSWTMRQAVAAPERAGIK